MRLRSLAATPAFRMTLPAVALVVAALVRGDALRRRDALGAAAVVFLVALLAARRDDWPRPARRLAFLVLVAGLCIAVVPFAGDRDLLLYHSAPSLALVLAGWSVVLSLPGGERAGATSLDWLDRRWVAPAVMIAGALGLRALHLLLVGRYQFATSDETFYLLQSGWMSLPGFGMHVDADLQRWFRAPFSFFTGDRLVTQYPPGWPAVLAAFDAVGLADWATAILGGASLALVFALGRRVHGRFAGAVAMALLASHTWFRETHVGYLSHPVTTFALVAAAWLVVDRPSPVGWRAAAIWAGAGALLALAVASRPLTGAALGLSIEAWRSLRAAGAWRSTVPRVWGWYAVGAAPVLAALLSYNAITTGHALTFGYAAVHGSLHSLGFGARGFALVTGGTQAVQFSPAMAVAQVLERAHDFAIDFVGLALVLPLLVVGARDGFRARLAVVAAFLVFPVGQFFYFGSSGFRVGHGQACRGSRSNPPQ